VTAPSDPDLTCTARIAVPGNNWLDVQREPEDTRAELQRAAAVALREEVDALRQSYELHWPARTWMEYDERAGMVWACAEIVATRWRP
jgi:hypothetical protein